MSYHFILLILNTLLVKIINMIMLKIYNELLMINHPIEIPFVCGFHMINKKSLYYTYF